MKWTIDKSLLLAILFFLGFGLVQVYSSSYIFAIESYGDGLHFVKRQALYIVLGFMVLMTTAHAPWRWIEKWGFGIWLVGLIGIALTFLPSMGITAGGAHRWLRLPLGQRFEPAELLKVSFPILLATFIARDQQWLGRAKWPVRAAAVFAPMILLLRQPDFGTFAICMALTLVLLFAFGLKWRYIFAALVVAVPAFYALVINVPYRYARIKAFLDPWADPSQKGFQVIQSMLSFHSGGVWGAGLGHGQGKLFFLPEAHTDFTLAVLGEELGFVGFVVILLLYGFIIYRGLQISLNAETAFAKATALGITIVIGLSVVINIGVVLGILPTKGLTLPFLSYGGSSLVSTCFACGLLLNIDRTLRKRPFKGYKV